MNDENQFGNLLDIISIVLQLQNLELNEKQINYLDEHLRNQDTKYLKKIIEQNEYLKSQNEEIISLLKDIKT